MIFRYLPILLQSFKYHEYYLYLQIFILQFPFFLNNDYIFNCENVKIWFCLPNKYLELKKKKSRIWDTLYLWTDADSVTLAMKFFQILIFVFFFFERVEQFFL